MLLVNAVATRLVSALAVVLWLGSSQDSAACTHATDVRAMQRGATNAWFPVVRSALAVAATPIGIALNACNPKQIEKVDASRS